jgi:hypothetical protein
MTMWHPMKDREEGQEHVINKFMKWSLGFTGLCFYIELTEMRYFATIAFVETMKYDL